MIGSWPTDSYQFDDSSALRDGGCIGLALDEHNQDELSDEDISKLIEQITPYFSK
ncbi:MAG: Flavodoxin [uncultured Sulfurimonas sp.]|nr:MAG: Flavodoxin [uncultured Sulfurimonas sp.]